MSDTLYRDKERATAREVICNAIDANIEAGLPDEPVDVTLTEDEMLVADSGNGIPHDKIDDIYLTVFGSQKAKDKRVTGGFGLGCKAPFSITDHFTVTSCHAGTKSFYAMVASDPEEDDCPSAKRMMKMPTDERGLRVSIPLAPGMRSKMERCIKEIAREGGMKVRLNGTLIEAPDFTQLKEVGFGVFGSIVNPSHNRLRLLYANVVYPIDTNPTLYPAIQKLTELCGGSKSHAPIIVYAQPSTVGVTPSRESLSYDDETVAVILKLLNGAIDQIRAALSGKRDIALGELMDTLTRDTLHLHEATRWRVGSTEEDFVGPEAIALSMARRSIREGTYSRREFVLKAAKRFPENRRSLLWCLTGDPRNHYGRGSSLTCDLQAERYHRLRKRVLRVAGPLAGLLLTREHSTSKLKSMKTPDAFMNYAKRTWSARIALGPTQKVIADDLTNGFALSTAKIDPAEIAALKKRAERYKIEILEFQAPPKVKREPRVKVPEQFGPPTPEFPLRFSLGGGSERQTATYPRCDVLRVHRSDKFYTPVAIYTAKGTTVDYQPAYVSYAQIHPWLGTRLVGQLIGRCAIVTKRDSLDWHLGQGTKRIEEIVLERLKARTKRPKPYESFYAKMALRAVSHSSGRLNDFACKSLRAGRRIAHAAVREPYKASADRDEAYNLWLLAQLIFYSRYVSTQHIDETEAELMKRLYEEYRELAMPFEARTGGEVEWWLRTDHLELLSSLNVNPDGLHGSHLDDFIHITEELAKRHAARIKEGAK
ncbi:ATP-binding protein [Methylorubrum extorquens]|uniref:ATP-binding protein n=1 Tax=Methylorubrum extorquens TaxID=408 RepID=UPI00209F12AB|nr:ATP-binding protein [Methylorubrum extorquens]MCP1539982.1 hypothetical protein [Methylorubrum extorquens]